jgi:hypothetical protein
MSNDLRNYGVVDQFHNHLLVVMLGLSISALPGMWPPIEVEAQLPLSPTWTREKSVSRAHVEISTPFDISTRDLRHQGVSSKILVILN